MLTFDQAFDILIGHEGGYVNDPRDPGGETKYGISKRAYPKENIKDLTLAQAKAIYYRDYWLKCGCDKAPAAAFDVFDMAVNSGVGASIKTLQRAAGVTPDGAIGPVTQRAIGAMDPERLAARFNGWRLDFLNDLPTWPTYGRGWAQRIAENLKRI